MRAIGTATTNDSTVPAKMLNDMRFAATSVAVGIFAADARLRVSAMFSNSGLPIASSAEMESATVSAMNVGTTNRRHI